MRMIYWTGVFLLMALVTHLAQVLLAPRLGARDWMREMGGELGENRLRVLTNEQVRRILRNPADVTIHAACLLSLAQRDVILRGRAPRGMWILTVYSPRGDVLYSISDRYIPPGVLHIRFLLRQVDRMKGEIALPRLQARRMAVPLSTQRALLLLEAWPWHPGQRALLRRQLASLQCAPVPRMEAPALRGGKGDSAAFPARVLPRPRPPR